MSDVSKFLVIVAGIFGMIWLVRTSWTGSLRWVEQQGQALSIAVPARQFWTWLTRLLGPLSALLFFLFVQPENDNRSNPGQDWDSKTANYEGVTYGGEETLPPQSDFCLVVVDSRAAKGPTVDTRYPLLEGIHAIGRAPTEEPGIRSITLKGDAAISRNHLYLEQQADGSFLATDRGSTYGTRLNNRPLKPEQGEVVTADDNLRLGNTTLKLTQGEAAHLAGLSQSQAELRIVITKGKAAGQSWSIGPRPLLIGRDKACQLRLADKKVSRRHAEVRREGQQVRIKDLNSTHGLFVNGHNYQSRVLESGDVIRLGNTELKFEPVA